MMSFIKFHVFGYNNVIIFQNICMADCVILKIIGSMIGLNNHDYNTIKVNKTISDPQDILYDL